MDNKKAAAAAVAAVITASGAAVEASFDSPADLLQDTSVDPKVEYVNMGADQDDGSMVQDDEEKGKQKAGSAKYAFREWILSLPMAVRVLFVLPQWFLGNLIVAGGELLFAGLTPVLHWVCGFALLALVIAGAFTVTAKAIFPDLPIRKILSRKNIKWILIASAGVFSADLILGMFWTQYAHFKALFMGLFTLIALGAIVIRFVRWENRRRARLCEEREAAEEEPAEELVYTSLGQTFTVRPSKTD